MSGAGNGAALPRTVVKICGITRLEDARAAREAGADWIGFVLWSGSARAIDPARAAEIAAAVPGLTTVAVMVSVPPDRALALAGAAGATRVQLHRVDPFAWPRDFPLPAAFAIPVESDGSLTAALPPEPFLAMLDRAHDSLAGGTGETIPWETARVVAATRDVLLAGGLDDGNVAEAIERVRPFGVDSSSRLESAPGIKDADRVRRFVAAVRRCDERLTAGS